MSKRLVVIALLSASALLYGQEPPAPSLIKGRNPADVTLRGRRFRPLRWGEMTPAQRLMVQHILAGERNGTLGGPFNVLLRSPEMGDLAQQFGEAARYGTGLTNKQLELAIIMTARAWSAQYEWVSHKRAALQAGLSSAIIDAVAVLKQPTSMSPDEEVVYETTNELLYARTVSDQTFRRAMLALDERKLVNLVTLVAYYELVSMLMVTDDYPLQEGVDPELRPVDLRAFQRAVRASLAPNDTTPTWRPVAETEGPSYGQYPLTRGRFKPLAWVEMSPAQKALAEQLLASERKAVTGNYLALLRSPELGGLLEKFGASLRFRGELPDRLRQLVVLMSARHWTTQFEWFVNHRAAIRAGLSEEQVSAIAQGKRPSSLSADEEVVYALLEELLRTRRVSDGTFRAAVDRLGERAVVNIVTLHGFFGIVSALMNLDLYPLPDGVAPELPTLP